MWWTGVPAESLLGITRDGPWVQAVDYSCPYGLKLISRLLLLPRLSPCHEVPLHRVLCPQTHAACSFYPVFTVYKLEPDNGSWALHRMSLLGRLAQGEKKAWVPHSQGFPELFVSMINASSQDNGDLKLSLLAFSSLGPARWCFSKLPLLVFWQMMDYEVWNLNECILF